MASAVMRSTMNHGQNLHVLPNNCVGISSQSNNQTSSMMHMHHHHHTHHTPYQHQYTMAGPMVQQHQQHSPQPQPQPQQQQQQQQQMSPVQSNQTLLQPQQIQPQPPHHRLGKRLLAPAPLNRPALTVSNTPRMPTSTPSASKKTKLTYAHMPYGSTQPASVQRRNARERNRVKQVNNGFQKLRQHIPSDVVSKLSSGGRGASKKLSKVDTLRIAVEYIRKLQDELDSDADLDTSSMASSTSSRLSINSTGSFYSTSTSPTESVPPPPCSESSASPTPSYSSDNSSIGGNAQMVYPTQHPFKYETYDNYYAAPDDDDILKYIQDWED